MYVVVCVIDEVCVEPRWTAEHAICLRNLALGERLSCSPAAMEVSEQELVEQTMEPTVLFSSPYVIW